MRKRVFVSSTLVVVFVVTIGIYLIELFAQVNIDVGIDAVQAAHRASGFNRFLNQMDIEVKAERLKIEEGDSRFPPLYGLHERMYGKSVWKVSYNGLRIRDARSNRESTIPGYDVFLDAETGIPFKIVSHWPPSINEKLKKDVRAHQQLVPLEFISPEIPEEPPTFTLGQLMEKAPAQFVSPYYVEAYYVLNSPPNRDPVWMFVYYAYGRPAQYADFFAKNPNAYFMLQDLYIYNARTGEEGWYITGIGPSEFDVGIDAVQVAHRVSGFNRFLDKMDIEVKAERIKVQKGDPLFPPLGGLHERMYGKSVWKVSYNGLRIHDARWDRESTIPGYDVFLDAETGIPLKIISHWPKSIDEQQKEDVRVMQKSFAGIELISPEIPEEPPAFTIGQLMEKVPPWFVVPYYLEAYYVLNRPPNHNPVWLFVYYGGGPKRPYSPPPQFAHLFERLDPNAHYRVYRLYILDARTGKELWYIASTSKLR